MKKGIGDLEFIKKNMMILEARKSMLIDFEDTITEIEIMIKEKNSLEYINYSGRLEFKRDCPFNGAIKYKYMVAFEAFKELSKALYFTHFKCKRKIIFSKKMNLMNRHILGDYRANIIEEIFFERNQLAHAWVKWYDDWQSEERSKKQLELLKVLKEVTIEYSEFIDTYGLFSVKKISL